MSVLNQQWQLHMLERLDAAIFLPVSLSRNRAVTSMKKRLKSTEPSYIYIYIKYSCLLLGGGLRVCVFAENERACLYLK